MRPHKLRCTRSTLIRPLAPVAFVVVVGVVVVGLFGALIDFHVLVVISLSVDVVFLLHLLCADANFVIASVVVVKLFYCHSLHPKYSVASRIRNLDHRVSNVVVLQNQLDYAD